LSPGDPNNVWEL